MMTSALRSNLGHARMKICPPPTSFNGSSAGQRSLKSRQRRKPRCPLRTDPTRKRPLGKTDVFVDDFIQLGQGGQARMNALRDHLLHAIDQILACPFLDGFNLVIVVEIFFCRR